MRRVFRVLFWFAAFFAATPIAAFFAYDLAVFQPRAAEIHSILSSAAPAEQAPPQVLVEVVLASRVNVTAHSARLLASKLNAVPPRSARLFRHLSSAAWSACVALHLSKGEQLAVFLALSYMGNSTTGFAASAISLFGSPLEAVSQEQAAKLVVISQAPSGYLASPERLANRTASLLEASRRGP